MYAIRSYYGNDPAVFDADAVILAGPRERREKQGFDFPLHHGRLAGAGDPFGERVFRITSYNVCYTKLLRFLSSATTLLADRCVAGITPNRKRCEELIEESLV